MTSVILLSYTNTPCGQGSWNVRYKYTSWKGLQVCYEYYGLKSVWVGTKINLQMAKLKTAILDLH